MSSAKTSLSPRDLARAVGVSESSVKRWADDGLLQFVRTAGGHRRIRREEAVHFIRQAGLAVDRPDLLGLRGSGAPARGQTAPTSASIEEAVFAGDGPAARRMLVSAFLQGTSVAALADGPIRSALSAVGHLWKEGPEGIALEHHAVDTCVQALMEIRGMIAVADDAPLTVGGAVEGDPYILPSLMAAIVLAEANFRALNLGPNVPSRALLTTVASRKPILVWRSASIEATPASLRAEFKPLVTGGGRAEFVIGGRGVPRGFTGNQAAVHHFESMTELFGFAKALRRPRQKS